MLLLVIRTAVLYVVTMLSMRIMGKRQIGQLQPFELVVILIISEMATIGVQDNDQPLLHSLLPIAGITVLQITIALLNMKSRAFRQLVCGKPTFVIKGGEILEEEMRRLRLNINDLLEQLRYKGFFDVAEVEYALMETNGQLSVMARADKRPVQPADLDLYVRNERPAITLIADGEVETAHLEAAGVDEKWLKKKLTAHNIGAVSEVFFMSVDVDGHIFCQLKSNGEAGSPAPIREGAKSAPAKSGCGTGKRGEK